ncbi:GDP-6-deoxy-D-mannose reductase [Paenibacillus allorhizoplanae]|uniref:GDP-6-deoxy-D-mannose reductase n=1 Tax=Paenibacillus allorhizoplanae TaxID=2905648 RepID=A0ABM9CYX7_9BACL|nr:GDP-mannose 4,6-dehydratase [Paenibacillus allorhizoplanae]CAH1231504.1 GDP-6-deoxy-D-mannose reductase [Paenibacillus allorhizoplanae]
MRALITGISGFVGKHLANYLLSQGVEVFGTTSQGSLSMDPNIFTNNLSSEQNIINLLDEIQPDHIYHLAGQSNVKDSWDSKVSTFHTNVNLTINLLEAVRKSKVSDKVRIVTIGSSEEYGRVNDMTLPIDETVSLKPTNPYGISKASVSYFAKQYYEAYGLKVVHVRPFNHIGPGQKLGFVVTDFTSQIVNIEKGIANNIIRVGNLGAQRDFTDVRDIVRAYYLLLTTATTTYGEIYNVCSGVPITIESILEKLLAFSHQQIEVIVDPNKLRPIDIPLYIGTNNKIHQLTGWKPEIAIDTTLEDVLEFIRKK